MEADTEQLSPDEAQVDQQGDPGDTSGHSDTLNTSGESRDPGLYFPQQTYPWQCFPNMAPSYPCSTGLQALDGLHPLLRGQPGPNGPSPPATPGIGEVSAGHYYHPPAPQTQYSQPPTPDSASSSSDLFQFPNQRADVQQQPSFNPCTRGRMFRRLSCTGTLIRSPQKRTRPKLMTGATTLSPASC